MMWVCMGWRGVGLVWAWCVGFGGFGNLFRFGFGRCL